MFKVGDMILLKQFGNLVNAMVIDVDCTFATLRLEYEKGKYCNIKVKKDSKEIFSIDLDAKNILKPKELYQESIEFNNIFRA